jgi:hydrogenase-4 component B
VGVYLVGLIISGIFSVIGKSFKKVTWIFVAANLVGLSAGVAYFLNFFGQTVVLADVSWFFHFVPQISLLSAIFFTVISFVSALVGIYSTRYLELYKETYNPGLTLFLMAFFVLGMQGVLFANNSFSFLFFWEVMSITSFFLVLADRTKESVKAAFVYFIMTHLGASAILGGFLILGKGALNFDLANIVSASAALSPALVSLSFALFFFGFGSKAGLVPFHVWLPEAHPQAPSNVSAMMSGLMLKIAVYGFLKVVFSFTFLPFWAGIVVIVLGLLSGLLGALYATVEKDMKRAFAFSSIENMGIIFTMLGLSLFLLSYKSIPGVEIASYAIISFAIFHAISHAMFKTALFLSSGVVIGRMHTKNIDAMGGLSKLMPLFSFAFLLAILGSLPIAPFGTFYGEWGLIQSIVQLMHVSALGVNAISILLVVLAFVGLIGGLAIFAMVKIFGISMLGLSRNKHMETYTEKRDYALTVPIMILGGSVLFLGFFANPILAALGKNELFGNQSTVLVSGLQISSQAVFVAIVVFIALTYVLKRLLSPNKSEREYHTWDCGQPIDATMQYTATAFSAPIRFFFLKLIGRINKLESTAVVPTNPWIRNFTFSFSIRSVWTETLYIPLAKTIIAWAEKVKTIQSGRIQYYLMFLLFTLIITLMIAL